MVLPPQAQELCAYLALYGATPLPRSAIPTRVWADVYDPDLARLRLRQTLWQLRTALRHLPQGAVFQETPTTLALAATAAVWVDVVWFEAACRMGHNRAGADLDAATAAHLQQAVGCYHGELLDGWDVPWCRVDREYYQAHYLQALLKLMDYATSQGVYDQALWYGQQLLRVDQAHEGAYQRLMRIYLAVGDRVLALRQYARCVAALADELGVEPSQTTRELYERIRA